MKEGKGGRIGANVIVQAIKYILKKRIRLD